MSVRFDCRCMQLVQPLLDECLAGYPPLTVPAPNPRPLPRRRRRRRRRRTGPEAQMRPAACAVNSLLQTKPTALTLISVVGTTCPSWPMARPVRARRTQWARLEPPAYPTRRWASCHVWLRQRAGFLSIIRVRSSGSSEMVRMWMPARTYSIGWTCCERSTAKPPFT